MTYKLNQVKCYQAVFATIIAHRQGYYVNRPFVCYIAKLCKNIVDDVTARAARRRAVARARARARRATVACGSQVTLRFTRSHCTVQLFNPFYLLSLLPSPLCHFQIGHLKSHSLTIYLTNLNLPTYIYKIFPTTYFFFLMYFREHETNIFFLPRFVIFDIL